MDFLIETVVPVLLLTAVYAVGMLWAERGEWVPLCKRLLSAKG